MRIDESKSRATPRRAKAADDITTMRARRSTVAALTRRQHDLGARSLDEALATILFREHSYEAIARLRANPEELAEYRDEALGLAEVDVEVVE